MKYTAALIAASAAVASAQVVYNSTTNTFVCPAYSPNGAFCAGNSLQTNIIIRCSNGIGQPGNCNDNLAGYPPQGVSFSPCFQTSPNAGDATCSKNCKVYYPNRQFNLPGCTPISSTTSASSTSTSTSSSSTSHSSSSASSSSTSASASSASSTTTHAQSTTTHIVPPPLTNISSTTTTAITTTHFVPPPLTTGTGITTLPSNATTTAIPPPIITTSTLPGGSVTTITLPPTSVSTLPGGGLTTITFSPTRTPVGPTTSGTTSAPAFTGAADKNAVAGMAVGLGAAVVMFL